MEEILKDIENFEGNLIYMLLFAMKKGNSGGMLSVIPELVKYKNKKKGLNI